MRDDIPRSSSAIFGSRYDAVCMSVGVVLASAGGACPKRPGARSAAVSRLQDMRADDALTVITPRKRLLPLVLPSI